MPCAVLLGLLVRVRTINGEPMPPLDPARWLLAGAAEDLAVTIVLAGLAALLFIRRPRAGAAIFGIAVALMLIAQFALSEGVIVLGHAVRGDDLETGFHPLLFTGSAAGGVLIAAIFLLGGTLVAAGMAWRLASRRRSRLTLSRLAAVTIIAVTATLVFTPRDGRAAAHNALVVAPSMLRNAAVDIPPAVIPQPDIDVRSVRELAGRGDAFISDLYPLAHMPPPRSADAIAFPSPHPNFVFILMESMRAEESGVYGDDPPGVTPNLDRIAREGIRIDPAFSAGGFTPEGELGILYGALASPYEIVIRSHPSVKLSGFPEILARNGWRSLLWLHGSDATLYLGGRFYRDHGIPVIDGRDFPADAPQTSWGISDRAVLRRGIESLGRLPQPFAAMIVTITNHHPFQLPDDALTQLTGVRATMGQVAGHSTTAMLRTLHYSDQALGEFFDAARTKPWFANTIFVIAGDHGISIPALRRPMTRHVFYELRHRIPLVIYSPRLPHGMVVRGPASQVDILPTLLGVAGVRGPLAGTGIDLLDPAQHDDTRPVISWELLSRTVTVNRGRFAYHATVPQGTTALTDELLVDTAADPDGQVNLVTRQLDVARACRRDASIYLRTYGWLIANDRAGLPQ